MNNMKQVQKSNKSKIRVIGNIFQDLQTENQAVRLKN